MEDEDLIKKIKNEEATSSEALRELINRHSGIYLDAVNACVPKTTNETNKEDLILDKDYHIYKVALDFEPSRNTKFPTYLCDRTKWMCYNLYKKNSKKKIVSPEEVDVEIEDSTDELEVSVRKDQLNKTLDYLSKHPDSRVEKIFNLRYIEGKKNKTMPWRVVSKELNMSIQGCINIHNKTLGEIKKILTK